MITDERTENYQSRGDWRKGDAWLYFHVKACAKLLLLFFLSISCLRAAEPSIVETTRLADSLDDLVQQRPPFRPEKFGKGVLLYAAAPVELERIVPIAADMLKIDKADLREFLKEDRHTLSHIVYARLLGAKRNKPWKPLLINGEDLFVALQKEGVSIAEIHQVLENLHTEIAFASLDSPVVPERHTARRSR